MREQCTVSEVLPVDRHKLCDITLLVATKQGAGCGAEFASRVDRDWEEVDASSSWQGMRVYVITFIYSVL